MRISLNWLKKYVDIKVSNEELIRLIGARLVEVEGVIDETKKYNNIYVAKVVSAEKIPETHLSLCQIDVGDVEIPKVEKADGLVQVVCGAPNVREGMLAVWIAPGAVVPASVNEDVPFVIGKRKMLGKYESSGMLAGADELDFSTEHKAIAEIDPEIAQPGDKLSDIFELDDLILEIENKSLTHRPDCFGLIGFAREVAGILGEKFEYNNTVSSGLKVTNEIDIKIADPSICERYTAVVLEKHGEIKKKYLTYEDTILSKSGMRPLDPIVDATNYLMLLTGQPLHAFDYDKFVKVGGSEKPKIIVRLSKDGEELELLDGKKIVLNAHDIVITSNDVPVALAGAMGGMNTEIDENTKNIIIEAATFSLYNLRKTQMAHGIFSEAITRFTKGQPPYQTLAVAEECAEILKDGFKVAAVSDERSADEKVDVVKITTSEINALLGTDYNNDLVVKTLENVGFKVKMRKNELEVTAPLWRTDIHIKEDVIEEVGRLLGYDNITPTLPRHETANKNRLWNFKTELRNLLSRFGANEVLTYSFVSERLLKKAGLDAANSYKIVNSISPELQLVRQTLVPSLLDKSYMNQKLPVEKFALFEINKVYQKEWSMNEENVPVEKMHLGFVLAERKNDKTAYYKVKNFAEKMFEDLNISVQFLPIKSKIAETAPFEEKRAAEIWADEHLLGVVGEFKNSVRHNFKLEPFLAGFELDVEKLLELKSQKKVRESFTPRVKEDVTITTDKTYAETLASVKAKYKDAEVSPVGIYQPAGTEKRNITFHVEKVE